MSTWPTKSIWLLSANGNLSISFTSTCEPSLFVVILGFFDADSKVSVWVTDSIITTSLF